MSKTCYTVRHCFDSALLGKEILYTNDEVAMKKTLMLIAAVLLLIPSMMFAAEQRQTQYDLGSQMFTFKAGPTIPLFTYFPNRNPATDGPKFVSGIGEGHTGLKVGGYGSISYQAFVNPYIALGGEIGYSFAYAADENLYTMVPIQAKATFLPVQGTIDLPISLGFGGAYNTYRGGSIFTMFASLEVGFVWYFNENWGVGLNCGYWFIPEIYTRANQKVFTALGNIMPITLSVSYRH